MQREMPYLTPLANAQWVPVSIVAGWGSYREAILWCWANRPRRGMNDPDDQATFARNAGVHAPHMCRYVSAHTKAPMDMRPDLNPAFEAYTGWRGITQYLAQSSGVTVMEQVISERRAA